MITIDDNYRLEDFGLRAVMDYTDPSTIGFSEVVQKIPGRPGVRFIKEEIDVRQLSVPFKLTNRNHVDINEKLDRLADLLYDEDGHRKEVKIKLDHWQGKYVMGYVASPIISDRRLFLSNLTLDFVCYDPNKYAEIEAEEILWGSEIIDFTSSYLLGHEGSTGQIQVTSNQTLDIFLDGLSIYPVIEITGTANNLKLTTNGQSVELPNFSNTTWQIERFNAWRNGQEVFVDAHKFKLSKGANKVTVTGSNMNFNLNIRVRDRYK
ncbi:distal tail protein Dit [Alkalibacterium sp. MB6]|uniref:distal tail protein Dit n=1 Tax=Alkalibacterium sp. MB6 TaxID=2081965 RepID=UPI001379B751|nr:distal tail protein Dit [Alkalibacterium sp. MB6]